MLSLIRRTFSRSTTPAASSPAKPEQPTEQAEQAEPHAPSYRGPPPAFFRPPRLEFLSTGKVAPVSVSDADRYLKRFDPPHKVITRHRMLPARARDYILRISQLSPEAFLAGDDYDLIPRAKCLMERIEKVLAEVEMEKKGEGKNKCAHCKAEEEGRMEAGWLWVGKDGEGRGMCRCP